MSTHEAAESEWGWSEPIETEEDLPESSAVTIDLPEDASQNPTKSLSAGNDELSKDSLTLNVPTRPPTLVKNLSQEGKFLAYGYGLKKGITSSPSFQELEKAIGATLAMSLGHTNEETTQEYKSGSFNVPNTLSMDSVAQHRLQQQRSKQRLHYQQFVNQNSPQNSILGSLPNATRLELTPFTNELESRGNSF
jgi:hypothetical protein